jgi:hypothetical protein
MFLRKRPGSDLEHVAITDPYDSAYALIDLSPGSDGLEQSRRDAEMSKQMIQRIVDNLLTGKPHRPFATVEFLYRRIDYYEQLVTLASGLRQNSEAEIVRFRDLCLSIAAAVVRPEQRPSRPPPGSGWQTDYPDKSFWWLDPTESQGGAGSDRENRE